MQNGGQCNRQGGDVGQCVEVCRAGAVAHPQPFLSRRLKAGIVTLTLCTQGVCSLETEAAAVNGKPVIRGDDPVFNATSVFLPVIPVFVVTRANPGSHRPNISSVISGYKQPSKSAQSIEITGFIEKSKPPEIIFFYTLLPLTA